MGMVQGCEGKRRRGSRVYTVNKDDMDIHIQCNQSVYGAGFVSGRSYTHPLPPLVISKDGGGAGGKVLKMGLGRGGKQVNTEG